MKLTVTLAKECGFTKADHEFMYLKDDPRIQLEAYSNKDKLRIKTLDGLIGEVYRKAYDLGSTDRQNKIKSALGIAMRLNI